MVDLREAVQALQRIDWDFPRSGTSARSIHTTHWFPGNFIPQIPAALIQILSEPGEIVFDPFAGSGTTGIEAWRLGRRSIMSDRLSPCLLIMRGKIELARGVPSNELAEILDRTTWEHECRSELIGRNGEGGSELLHEWFSASTLAQLRYLWQLVERSSLAARPALTLLFSDVLFASASSGNSLTATGGRRRHHWGWVADNVLPKERLDHKVIDGFRDRLVFLRTIDQIPEGPAPLLLRQDARQSSLRAGCVDLVVTSPPYVGVIDYAHANRLLYIWMNWPLREERNTEIGARSKRFRRTSVQEYLADMAACWAQIAHVLRPGGFCAIVIGESRKFPGAVAATTGSLEDHLRLVWGPAHRIPSRRRVSDRSASEATEQVLVYQKPW